MHENERILKFSPLIRNLYNSARESLGFKPHASISIIDSSKNANNPLGKTAHYSPSERKIALYTRGRHIKDIMRSLAHELVHHNQNCRGDFETDGGTMPGYAQEDGHMREMEREAYEVGNLIFRDWEDNLKDKGGKPLFSSTAPYVPAPTSGVVGGRLLEENTMENNLTKSQLQEFITKELKELMEDKPLTEAPAQKRTPYPASGRQAQIDRADAKRKAAKKAADHKERSKPASQRVKELGLGPPKAGVASARSMAKGKGFGVDTSMDLNIPSLDISKAAPAAAKPERRKGPNKWIKNLQSLLNKTINAGLDADGYSGPKTKAAIRDFQKRAGLSVDGIAGRNTMKALRRTSKKAQSGKDWLKAADKADKGDKAPPSSVDFEKGSSITAKPAAAKPATKKKGFVPLSQRMFGKSFGQKGAGGFSDEEKAAYQTGQREKEEVTRQGYKSRMARTAASNKAKLAAIAVRKKERAETPEAKRLAQLRKSAGFTESLSKEDNMKKEIKESQLRNMIRGVIQEMFEEDLNEDNMGMPPNAEAQEASEEDAEAAAAAATTTASGGSTGEDYQVEEGLKEDSGEEEGEEPSPHEICMKKFKHLKPGITKNLKITSCKNKLRKQIQEDSGEEEEGHYDRNVDSDEDHIDQIRGHLDALEHDKDYDEEHEDIHESFFPKGRSTREKARKELNKGLMKRWGFTEKEK